MKKINIIFIFLFLTHFNIFGQDLTMSSNFLKELDPDVLMNLRKNKQIFRYDEENIGVRYLPDTFLSEEIKNVHKDLNPDVMVEALYQLELPKGMSKAEVIDKIIEISHRVSTISGVQYYSIRKKDYSILFKDVYAVNNLTEKKKIIDPLPNKNNNSNNIYLHMKENAMGNGYYKMMINKTEDSVYINLSNESALNFIFRVVNPKDMFISLKIFPYSDCIIIYGYCGVVIQNKDFVKFVMDPYYAFYRRMTAMETWLSNSLNGKNELPPVLEPLS